MDPLERVAEKSITPAQPRGKNICLWCDQPTGPTQVWYQGIGPYHRQCYSAIRLSQR